MSREPLHDAILDCIAEIGGKTLATDARGDLTAFFPERYANFEKVLSDYSGMDNARSDYMGLIRMYLINNRMPVTIENLTCAFLWGFTNFKRHGLDEAPTTIKRIVGWVRISLEPEAIRLEEQYNK